MGLMDSRNALGMASPQDQQFARRAKSAVEGSLPYQNFKQMVTGPIDQVSDIYAVLNGTGTQQEADNIVRRVGEGLIGMGGFTKNGVPHNNPEVVHAYRKALHDAASANGKQLRSTVNEYPWATTLNMELMDNVGGVHVIGAREFKPEGVHNVYLQTMQKDKPAGLLSWLYPTESEFMQKYGGELWGDFVNPKTHEGFFRSNPDAYYNEKPNKLKAVYPGAEDFPFQP